MRYNKVLRDLYQTNARLKTLGGPVGQKLDAVTSLDSLFPKRHFDLLAHIAGTNGKGSTSFKLSKALQSHYSHVGLFTSPHVSSFRERFRINQKLVSESRVVELYELCVSKARSGTEIPISFFELVTVMGMEFFRNCDAVVVEAGLGGRLDATQICSDNVSIAIIPSIGLDHTRVLGDTLEEIAYEKAGIIKPLKPCVVSGSVPKSALEVIQKACVAKKSPLVVSDFDPSDYNASNTLLVSKVMDVLGFGELSRNEFREISKANPPCRFEWVCENVLMDAAHNAHAVEQLFLKLVRDCEYRPTTFVVALSADKDSEGVLRILAENVSPRDKVAFCAAKTTRAADPRALQAVYGGESTIAESVSAAVERGRVDSERVVVFGSIFMLSEARKTVGVEEPRDPDGIKDSFVAGALTSR